MIVISDDAYFGLFYKDSITESLFGRLANIHPRVLAIKVDGATKEEYTWGFRVGFLTFAINSDAMNEYLEEKVMGVIRTSISNGPTPSQTFILHALIYFDSNWIKILLFFCCFSHILCPFNHLLRL